MNMNVLDFIGNHVVQKRDGKYWSALQKDDIQKLRINEEVFVDVISPNKTNRFTIWGTIHDIKRNIIYIKASENCDNQVSLKSLDKGKISDLPCPKDTIYKLKFLQDESREKISKEFIPLTDTLRDVSLKIGKFSIKFSIENISPKCKRNKCRDLKNHVASIWVKQVRKIGHIKLLPTKIAAISSFINMNKEMTGGNRCMAFTKRGSMCPFQGKYGGMCGKHLK